MGHMRTFIEKGLEYRLHIYFQPVPAPQPQLQVVRAVSGKSLVLKWLAGV